ncbi:protein SRG1 [Rhodamnia argentea]|uniref:Protein SRG1 n=1 Tax=Rhodamnia argentea TaxID=178133 RepID=A0A8B8QJJ2_9MYRT|nr:protein SRG1 [Rhodamnia argentea]
MDMAQPPPPLPPAQSVQELILDGGTVPERYAYKDDRSASFDESLPLMDVPVIDLGLLPPSSSSSAGEELIKLRSALACWGCFQATNHGISCSFLDQVHELTQQFFALPKEEKEKCARAPDGMEGYGNDMVLLEQQVIDWNDRLYIIISPEDQRKLEVWPEKPETFREVMHEYSVKLRPIINNVFKAMALSLNLEENCFLNQFGEQGVMFARFNYYPRCPRPDLVLGLKPHADGSTITLVLPDREVEGLQFLRDGQWFRVPTIPDALLINVGDQVEIISNGIFKSPMHRAVTNAESDRISLAVFCTPEEENEIGPADELIDEETPRLYKKIRNYTKTYFEYYQSGKRPIDAVKI